MRRLLGLTALVFATAACTPEEVQFWIDTSAPHRHVVSDERLERLRSCESGGRYDAVNPSGKYRGAYQFDQRTWDSVASRHHPWLVNHDPAKTEPAWQDSMARALWSERGNQPWPNC